MSYDELEGLERKVRLVFMIMKKRTTTTMFRRRMLHFRRHPPHTGMRARASVCMCLLAGGGWGGLLLPLDTQHIYSAGADYLP